MNAVEDHANWTISRELGFNYNLSGQVIEPADSWKGSVHELSQNCINLHYLIGIPEPFIFTQLIALCLKTQSRVQRSLLK